METINTVNVIEMLGHQVELIASFHEGEEGNKSAEALFVVRMKKQSPVSTGGEDFTDEEIQDALDEGNFEQGHCHLMLVHSTI